MRAFGRRFPRPTRGSSALLVVGIVGAAVAVLCLIPAGLVFAWLGLRDRPAAAPVAAADTAPVKPAVAAQPSGPATCKGAPFAW